MTSTNKLLDWEDMNFADRLILKQKSEKSFLNFTRIWFELLQGDRLLVNWHHKMMAASIDDLINGKLKPGNLIVNIPPGGTKTEFFSIHLPAYINTKVQSKKLRRFRNLNVSYADSLVRRNSRRTRDIIASKEYQELWPSVFGVNQAEEWELIDDKGRSVGQTISKSAGGQITGGRAGYFGPEFSGCLLFDDLNKPDDMLSNTKRDASNARLTGTFRSRRGDKSKEHPTPIVSIQQRLHTLDATGFMMAGGMGVEFKNIAIPALVTEDYIATLPEPYRQMCWDTVKDTDSVEKGGVRYWSYWPEMEHVNDLMSLWERDEYTFMSQYMQRPQALTGGLLDSAWLQRYEQLPQMQWRAVYADTAQKKGEQNDYSVFELWGLGVDNNAYLIDVRRGKWDADELITTAQNAWAEWSSWDSTYQGAIRHMAIEDKASGTGLIQTLTNKKHIPIKAIPRGPDNNKVSRCLDIQSYVKNGRVFVPAILNEDGYPILRTTDHNGNQIAKTDWVLPFLAEVADFSADDSHKHDDQLDPLFDAVAEMLIEQQASGGVFLPARMRR